MWEVLAQGLLLEQALRFDLREFELDEFVVLRQTAQPGKHAMSVGLAVVMNEPARAEGHEYHAYAEQDCGRELQAQGHEPSCFLLGASRAADEVRAVVDPEGNHDSERDAELLQTDKRAADFGRCNLSIVHRHDHAEGADAHTGDEAAGENGVVACAGGGGALDDDSDDEDGDVDEDGVFTGENFGKETRVHCSEPGAKFEDGDEPALLGGVPFEGFGVGDVVAHVWWYVSLVKCPGREWW